MDTAQLAEQIGKLPTRQLIVAMRFFNGGPLGFDYMKKTKADLQALAVPMALRYAHATHPGDGFESTVVDMVEALRNDKRVSGVDASIGSVVLKATAASRLLEDLLASGGDTSDGSAEEAGGAYGGGEGDENAKQRSGPGEGEGKRHKGVENSGEPGGDGEGKDGDKGQDAQGKGKDGKDGDKGKEGDKPKKAPSTPQEMMAEALRQMLGADKPQEPDQAQLEKMIQAEMEKRANVYRVEVKHNDPLLPDFKDEEKPRHEVFKEVLQAVLAGRNVLLVGPAGCGKTTMAQDVSKAVGFGFKFSGAVASEYKLLGFINAQGALVRTQYREAYEFGSVFLWDELDASAAQAMLSFNAGLDNGFQDFPDTVIPRHANFRAIASANTWGHGADRQYVGRNQMDGASLDRFYTIPMDYDETLERSLFGSGEWVLYVQAARKASRKVGVRHIISMRAIRDGLIMLKHGLPRADVERGALWKHLSKEDVHKVKASMMGGA